MKIKVTAVCPDCQRSVRVRQGGATHGTLGTHSSHGEKCPASGRYVPPDLREYPD